MTHACFPAALLCRRVSVEAASQRDLSVTFAVGHTMLETRLMNFGMAARLNSRTPSSPRRSCRPSKA